MIKRATLYYCILGIFVVLDGYFLPGYIQKYFEYAFVFSLFVLVCIDPFFRKPVFKEKVVFSLLILLLLLSVVQTFTGRYRNVYSLSNTCMLIGAFSFFSPPNLKPIFEENKKKYIFKETAFFLMFSSLLYQFITRINEDPAVVNNIYEVYYSLGRDKNLLGIIVFTFFCICYKKRSKLGILLCLVFAFTLQSRMLQMNLLIFVVVQIFREKFYFFWNLLFRKKEWLLFLASFVFIIFFSIVFVEYSIANGISEYRQSWVDGSNYIRMTSNLYALNKIREDSYFIFNGVGNSIYEYLGITEGVRYLGERVVQPHNDIMNLLVRSGLMYSLIYWFLYGKLMRGILNKDNISYFASFFVSSMFIRPIFLGATGIIVLYVLALESKESESWFQKIRGKREI